MITIGATLPKPDHRIEVARRKRQAMRSRILRATLHVYSSQPASPPAVDDIIKVAGISKGGFYRYFGSTADALQEIGCQLADELAALIGPIYDCLSDPLQRACVGTILVLRRAAGDPGWADFMLHADLSTQRSRFLDFIEGDIRDGVASGQFQVEDVALGIELVMGINQVAMRGIAVRPEAEREQYIRFAVRFLLRSIGVSVEMIGAVITWSEDYLASLPHDQRWWESVRSPMTGMSGAVLSERRGSRPDRRPAPSTSETSGPAGRAPS